MSEHITDLLPLYALGILHGDEPLRVEAHVERCAACAAELAIVSDDVAAMAAAQTQVEPPEALQRRLLRSISPESVIPVRRWSGAMAALAAVLVIALMPSVYLWEENQHMHDAMAMQALAIARVAESPHRTVAFRGNEARVMYGANGSWYCIVVRGVRVPVDVLWKHDGTMTKLGTAVPHGDVAMLYLPQSHRMDQLALMEDNHVMDEARLVF